MMIFCKGQLPTFFVVECPIYPDFKDIDEGGSTGVSINLTDRQNEIIKIIKSDNRISYRAIAKKLDINDPAVDKHIKLLKEKGIYCRKACCYLFSFLPVRRYFWWIKGKQIKE